METFAQGWTCRIFGTADRNKATMPVELVGASDIASFTPYKKLGITSLIVWITVQEMSYRQSDIMHEIRL